MKAAVLGIGTELTDGQIFNKNAAWISKNLKNLGLTTSVHLVVPDERSLMREGLEFCAEKSDLLFVTGGLGPTSDDFTREIISEWAEAPLKFDEISWNQIVERLTSRGFAVKEIQRQQCFFPEGAKVLNNTEGTANAFFMEVRGKKVFVLPGPPREIEAVWNNWIDSWLRENTIDIDPYITHTWDTMGVGESDVALIVEEVLKKSKKKKFEIGYRVHMPYVEVKFSHFKSDTAKVTETIEKITEALKFCTITRDGNDVVNLLAKKLQATEHIYIEDEVTGSYLMNRIIPGLRSILNEKDWNFSNSAKALAGFSSISPHDSTVTLSETHPKETSLEHSIKGLLGLHAEVNLKPPEKVYLRLLPKDDLSSCEVSLETPRHKASGLFTTPYKLETMRERSLQYFAEMALVFWMKNLEG